MAVRLSKTKQQALSFTSDDLRDAIAAALDAGKVIGVVGHIRVDATAVSRVAATGTNPDGSSAVFSFGDSNTKFMSPDNGANSSSGSPAACVYLNGTTGYETRCLFSEAGNAGGTISAGSVTGLCWLINSSNQFALSANTTSATTSTTLGALSTDSVAWAWPSSAGSFTNDGADIFSIGTAASQDIADAVVESTCFFSMAVEHVAIVALTLAEWQANTNAAVKRCTGDGTARLTPREAFGDEDIIAYWPLTENLDSEIYSTVSGSTVTQGVEGSNWSLTPYSTFGFHYDDEGVSLKQPTKETLTASDFSGAFLGSTRPSSIRALRTAKKKTVYNGPTSVGTTVANGWRTTKDVLIRGIQPDSDGIQSAEGEGGEHVRPWAISAAGVQLGTGSSSGRAYTRAQGASSWDRTDDTTQWSGLWTFPDSENVIGYSSGFYVTSVADIIAGTAPTAATSDVTLVTDTITNPITGSGSSDVVEGVSLPSVATGPGGIACFAPYSGGGNANNYVRKIWTTDDGGVNWTEVFNADDSTWDDDWAAAYSGFTPGNKKLRLKHFHGPAWIATENKWLCPYGDGYAQTGAIVCGPDPSAPATDVLQSWQLRSSQPFGLSVFKGKILGGCDRVEGNGYHEYDGTFVPLEHQMLLTDQARHSFHTFTDGRYGYFAPHPEDSDSRGVSSVPVMAIKDFTGLVQVPYWISRNETGAANIVQMDNNAGVNNGEISLEVSTSGFQHFKLTKPKLRTAKGFAVLPARVNLWEGSMDGASGGPGVANWSVAGDYTSLTNVNDPDGNAVALKGTIPSGTHDSTSTIAMSRSNLEVTPNITKPGLGFSAYVAADIPLDCTLGFGINSVITSSSLSSIDAALVWKRLRNASLLWDTLNTWIINLFVAANIGNSDGYGEMRNTALAGELQIANIMLGRAPIIDVHVEAEDAKAGADNYAAQQATYYEYDITTDAEWSYLFHIEPLNSAWEYRGHQNNNRHTIAEFELANGRKVALEALPVAYTTIDTVSTNTLTLDDSVATADMEGNIVWTTTSSAAGGETNYIDTYTSGTSIDVTAGSYVAPTAGDHCWIEALSLYVVEYDASGSEVTSERLGRFNVQYGVAIPVGIGFTSGGKAVGYHAAEGKGVIGSGITLNGAADFTETTVTIRHGNNENVERIMPHYCTVVDYYDEGLAVKDDFNAKFDAAAVEDDGVPARLNRFSRFTRFPARVTLD